MMQTLKFFALLAVATVGLLTANLTQVVGDDNTWYERKSTWNGCEQFHFKTAGRASYLVVPKQPAKGNPWIWRARFPGYHAEMDVALLGEGFHVGYVDVADMFGSPQAVAIGDQFYEFLTTKRGLRNKVCLEGVSRGGLFVYNWAAKHPESVACIYCDTPVCDFRSWPGGKKDGLGSAAAWRKCLQAYGLSEEESLTSDKQPIDHAKILAESKIPILHIVSENDRVVPPDENTYILKERLEQHGHAMEVISVPKGTQKSHGHHFDHPAVDRVVTFIRQHQ